jgi:hypothetical protein
VAKVIATIGGVALKPGVSRNRRLYTRSMIASAVAAAQERIRGGAKPVVMKTHHGAGDDSRQIVAHLTGVSLGEDGSARYTAAIADTAAGRDMAALIDTSDGQEPHLKGVSITGFWTGTVRKVTATDGDPAETADGLSWEGLDFTHAPGVDGAANDTFAWARGSDRTETTERVLITESAEEAFVTFTEETAPAKAEAGQSCDELGHQCCKDAQESAGAQTAAPPGTTYADPGYLADKKKRYPLNSEKRIRAAWSYINQKDNASQYTAQQLKRIKGKIKAAMKRIGAKVTDEGWVVWPAEKVTEADADLAEFAGGSDGSFCVNATNGPLNVSISSYCVDPADLELILPKVTAAATDALKALDPDMDGDMDVPGADSEDTDHDAGESAPEDEIQTETDPAASVAAATTEEEDSEMTETTTPAEQAAPALDPKILAEAIAAGLAQHEEARAAREADERKAAEEAAEKAAAEAAAQESADARIARLVAEGVKNALASEQHAEDIAAATETEDQKVSRLVSEALVTERQKLAERGVGTDRKGLTTGAVDEHRAPRTDGGTPDLNTHGMPGTFPDKPAEKLSATELRANAAPYLAAYVFGDRAQKFG